MADDATGLVPREPKFTMSNPNSTGLTLTQLIET